MVQLSRLFFILLLTAAGLLPVVPAVAQKVLAGPWLVRPCDTAMTLRWELGERRDNYVGEYGRDTAKVRRQNLQLRGSREGGYLYEARLHKLRPGTKYYYRLSGLQGGPWHRFRTDDPRIKKFSFVAMGDSRSNPGIFSKIMQGTEEARPDLIISMGDLVGDGGSYEQWHSYYFQVVEEVASTVPLVSALGDHEGENDNGALFRYFLCDREPVDSLWFSFDYGDAHFISLDYRHPEDPAMIRWFEKDIASAHKKWNFVFMHRPSYNLGGHASAWGRDLWPSLFEKYGVDIVFAGHSHIYERFYPARPEGTPDGTAVTYITTGGAGAGLYESVSIPSVLAFARSVNHFVDIHIDKDVLEMKTIDMDGKVIDRFRIVKKKGKKVFDDKVISDELLNTVTGFNSAISGGLSAIPLRYHPAWYELEMRSWSSRKIPYTVCLTRESAETYSMDPYTDTLEPGTERKIFLKILRKKEVTVSPWGSITPELRLMIIYEYGGVRDTIVGRAVEYWPPRREEDAGAAVETAPGKVFAIQFSKRQKQVKWALKDLAPALPTDWSDYQYMLIEVRTSPAHFFWFGIETEDGILRNRIMPFPDT